MIGCLESKEKKKRSIVGFFFLRFYRIWCFILPRKEED